MVTKYKREDQSTWDRSHNPWVDRILGIDSSRCSNALGNNKLYLIGALKNPEIPRLASKLRQNGWDVFDDWFAAGPEADDYWRDYEKGRGRGIVEALQGHAGRHVFGFDKQHLDEAGTGLLVLPAGRSGHLELGYMAGLGRPCYVLLAGDPDRYDVMYQFATRVFATEDELLENLRP